MKSEFNFKIVYPNGKTIDLYEDLNYWVSQCRVQPISFIRKIHRVDGRSGLIETGVDIEARKIEAVIQIEGYDAIDFDYMRDKVQSIFNPFDEFYIIRDLQPGKRYKVKVDNLSEIAFEESSLEDGSFNVDFIMLMPFAESIGTSIQLQNAKEWDADLWQWSQGIDGDKIYRYEHDNNNFSINNFGDIKIDPCEHALEIVIKATAANHLQITNHTTGDVYRYNAPLIATDTLLLKNIKTFKNGISVFGNTNKRLISLESGENDFSVSGGTIHSIAFNFRPLYY